MPSRLLASVLAVACVSALGCELGPGEESLSSSEHALLSAGPSLGATATTPPSFIPSVYGYSVGTRSYLRTQLAPFCDSSAPAQPGSTSALDYAHVVYNLSLKNLREQPAFYAADLDWLLACARKTGKLRVLVNFNFYESLAQKNQTPGYTLPNLDSALSAFDLLLGGPKNLGLTFTGSGYAVLAGITLAEENVTWEYVQRPDGTATFTPGLRAQFLSELYTRLKQKHGGKWYLKFFQWYSPNKVPNYPGYSSDWPVIPADGWVFDQYTLDVKSSAANLYQGAYYQYVSNLKKLGLPVFSVVFASPLRNPSASDRGLNFEWWNAKSYDGRDGGWVKLHGQVAINQLFKVPTIYYPYTPLNGVDTNMLDTAIPTACGEELFTFLVRTTWPYVKGSSVPLTLPAERPEWIPSAPSSCQ